jgi:2-keto-4-pentenoate hydratase/2-oxohepta-3-ene-1,7-dioic acid hydratase in catechol pathway
VVPADLVGDPQDLRITLALNGEVVQNESTKNMLFGVAAASRVVPLPGDLLHTGSPAGNGIHHRRLAAGRRPHGVDDHRARRAAERCAPS